MRRKYLKTMSDDEAQILDRATHTIVQQVEAMKEMVNAFSDYARAPDMDISVFDIEKLVHEVVELYRAQESGIKIVLNTNTNLPSVEADVGRVRQMLHNLVRNAIEALESTDDGCIDIGVNVAERHEVEVVEIVHRRSGPRHRRGPLRWQSTGTCARRPLPRVGSATAMYRHPPRRWGHNPSNREHPPS